MSSERLPDDGAGALQIVEASSADTDPPLTTAAGPDSKRGIRAYPYQDGCWAALRGTIMGTPTRIGLLKSRSSFDPPSGSRIEIEALLDIRYCLSFDFRMFRHPSSFPF